ncbi:MAG: archaellin/type IV pilin N-terminal domain-containing protein [Candidatus Bathyarchaeia archaeon]
MTEKIVKSRRAISPILATLLLVVIAVAAIVVTYAWVMTYVNSTATQAGVFLKQANVNFYGTANDKIDIDIENTGTSDAHLIQVYVGTSSSTLENLTSSSLPETCAAGHVARITVNYNWTSGTTYYFKVIAQEQILGPFGQLAGTS